MRLPTFAKIMALAMLSITTITVTSSVADRFAKSRRANPDRQGVAPGNGPTTEILEPFRRTPPTPLGQEQQPRARVISSAGMRRFAAEAIGNIVHVEAEGSIENTRPNMVFCWYVQVRNVLDKEIVFGQRFGQGLTAVDIGKRMTPSFDDLIQLDVPDGDYLVQAFICVIPPVRIWMIPKGLKSSEWAAAAKRW
jgi:hypothetical protein